MRFLFASVLFAVADALLTGVSGSVATPALGAVLTSVLPFVEAEVTSMSIPGTSGSQDGFDYELKDIHCSSFTIAASSVTSAPGAGLTIALGGMALQCSADWNFKLHIWPHKPSGSGTVDISVTGTSATLGVLVTAAALHPQMQTSSVDFAVGSINLTFHGSILDWLLNLFKGYIEDRIKSGLTSAFSTAIATVIAKQIDPALAAMPMAIPLSHAPPPYNTNEVRFGLTDNPTFTAAYMAVDLQGDVVPIADQRDPPIAPPALPPWTAASADYAVQLQLSSYTPESALYAFYTAGALSWLLPPADLPLGLNTTAGYALIAPGLPAAYPGRPVEMNVSFASLPNITFSPSGIAVAALLRLDWIVPPVNGSAPVAAFSLLAQTDFSGAIVARAANGTAQPAALVASIAYINSTLTTLNSIVGPVNTPLLQALVDDVFAGVIVPIVNALIATGLPLPQIDGVTLVNPAVIYNNGFVTVATNFTFVPPSTRGRPSVSAATDADANAVPADHRLSWRLTGGDDDRGLWKAEDDAPAAPPRDEAALSLQPDRHAFISGNDDDDAPAPPRDEAAPPPQQQPDRHFLSGNDDAAAATATRDGSGDALPPPLFDGSRPNDDDPVLRPVRDVIDQLLLRPRGVVRRRGAPLK